VGSGLREERISVRNDKWRIIEQLRTMEVEGTMKRVLKMLVGTVAFVTFLNGLLRFYKVETTNGMKLSFPKMIAGAAAPSPGGCGVAQRTAGRDTQSACGNDGGHVGRHPLAAAYEAGTVGAR
jgi:hypothetical protein